MPVMRLVISVKRGVIGKARDSVSLGRRTSAEYLLSCQNKPLFGDILFRSYAEIPLEKIVKIPLRDIKALAYRLNAFYLGKIFVDMHKS